MNEAKTEFVYVTYISSTAQKVWDAITNPEFARQYWGHGNVSDWKPGSKWEMVRGDGLFSRMYRLQYGESSIARR